MKELTKEQKQEYKEAVECHICKKPFLSGENISKDVQKVRDHNHLTGKYRGPAHNACNRMFQVPYHIPIVFHNLKSYDGHLIMQQISQILNERKCENKRLHCIPNNKEKYLSFTVGSLRFIDSLQFLNCSLEKLVKTLGKDPRKFPNLLKYCKKLHKHYYPPYLKKIIIPYEDFKLLLRKGVYAYEYITSEAVLRERCLPPKSAFYNKLRLEDISDEDYEHAQKVWKAFECETLADYHNLYMGLDVLLLSDVFENFREVAMSQYHLDPAHVYTLPQYSWEAMLKMTGVQLELMEDQEMYDMIAENIRGGVSTVVTKYARANNPLLQPSQWDESKPESYLVYLDSNNLYGWALMQPLPHSGFKWLSQDELNRLDVTEIPDDSEIGYIVQVDLVYPEILHDEHNDFPVAPEHMKISHDMLSPYSLELKKELDIKAVSQTKLIPNLNNKTKYVVHYRNLKQYLRLGLKLTKIHRAISFNQSKWVKPFIDFNSDQRKKATSDFEKDLYKLMSNAIFGKSCENKLNRTNVELVYNRERALKVIAKPSYDSFTEFNPALMGVQSKPLKTILDKPMYVGFSVLDLSKFLMVDFWYNYIKKLYGSKAKLVLTDTDSYIIHIEDPFVYEDMIENDDLFDFSNNLLYPAPYKNRNKKLPGKFKDELGGRPMKEIIGLRSKQYSFIVGGTENEMKTCKGVNKAVRDHELKYSMFKDSLLDEKIFRNHMLRIQSKNHELYTFDVDKVSLSPFDDKRWVLDDKINTLAFGHYKIKKI